MLINLCLFLVCYCILYVKLPKLVMLIACIVLYMLDCLVYSGTIARLVYVDYCTCIVLYICWNYS